MSNNKLILKIKPEDIEIIKKNNIIEINILNSTDIVFNLENNLMFKTKGQFHILADGEISFASKDGLHIDTIDSKLFLNSRNSSILKDLPESIKYRTKMELEYNKIKLEALKQEEFTLLLKDRVSLLENKIKELENARSS
jgi:hypothetical protein